MSKENIATLEMLLCAMLWSIAGIFMKLIPWNGFAVASMRSLVAGVTIFLVSSLVNHWLSSRIRRIDMVSSLKANE